jgi:DNA-binding NtrC family response regulator
MTMGQDDRSLDALENAQGLEVLFDGLLRRSAEERGGKKPGLRDWVELAEAWRIAHALRESRGNRSAAARALGIGRRTLYSKMERLGIAPSWGFRAGAAQATVVSVPGRFANGSTASSK